MTDITAKALTRFALWDGNRAFRAGVIPRLASLEPLRCLNAFVYVRMPKPVANHTKAFERTPSRGPGGIPPQGSSISIPTSEASLQEKNILIYLRVPNQSQSDAGVRAKRARGSGGMPPGKARFPSN
jgi:hypothetical protein